MANKWAIANGNWSDGSTWNDGVVPTAGDDVYCNSYIISLNVDTISFKTLSNKSDDNINYGGHIVYSRSGNNISIVGNSIYCNGTESIIQYDNISYSLRSLSFVCDIHNEENASVYAIVANNASGGVTITGNVYGSRIAQSTWNPDIVFNGISYRENGILPLFSLSQNNSGQTNGILEIYGIVADCVLESRNQMTQAYITIVGEYRCNEAAFFYQDRQVYKITLDGEIYLNGAFDNFNCINLISNCKYFYVSTNYKIGMNFERISNITISNPDTFILKDITNPRTNPFVIITNAELNNRQQYPQESDVKNGVEYAYGLKEGNYAPNFPQEANVLKDVEYDDGNKVGTLEVIALSGATAQAENISVVNLTEQDVNRVKNCATVSTVQKCFEDFKE